MLFTHFCSIRIQWQKYSYLLNLSTFCHIMTTNIDILGFLFYVKYQHKVAYSCKVERKLHMNFFFFFTNPPPLYVCVHIVTKCRWGMNTFISHFSQGSIYLVRKCEAKHYSGLFILSRSRSRSWSGSAPRGRSASRSRSRSRSQSANHKKNR